MGSQASSKDRLWSLRTLGSKGDCLGPIGSLGDSLGSLRSLGSGWKILWPLWSKGDCLGSSGECRGTRASCGDTRRSSSGDNRGTLASRGECRGSPRILRKGDSRGSPEAGLSNGDDEIPAGSLGLSDAVDWSLSELRLGSLPISLEYFRAAFVRRGCGLIFVGKGEHLGSDIEGKGDALLWSVNSSGWWIGRKRFE